MDGLRANVMVMDSFFFGREWFVESPRRRGAGATLEVTPPALPPV